MRIERNVFMAGRRSKTHPYKAVRENGEVICYGTTKAEAQQKAIEAMEEAMEHCLTTPAVGMAKDGRVLVGRIWARGQVYLQWFEPGTWKPTGSTIGNLDGDLQGMVVKYVRDYDEAMGHPAVQEGLAMIKEALGPCEHDYSYATYPAGQCRKCGAHG